MSRIYWNYWHVSTRDGVYREGLGHDLALSFYLTVVP